MVLPKIIDTIIPSLLQYPIALRLDEQLNILRHGSIDGSTFNRAMRMQVLSISDANGIAAHIIDPDSSAF